MTFQWIAVATTSLLTLIDSLGYIGIFLLMAAESTVFPVPSEAVMIPAGALVAQGDMNLIAVFFAGVLGNVIGALFCYWIVNKIGRLGVEKLHKKYGKYFLISDDAIKSADNYFKKHGHITIFVGRLIPGVRHIISIPAGFARMNLWEFTTYTTLGSALWCAVLLGLGYLLASNKEQISYYLGHATIAILAFVATVLVVYLWHQAHKRRR